MNPLAQLRERVRDEAQKLREEIAESSSDETFYKDGKLIGLLWTLEQIDSVAPEQKAA